MFLCAAFGIFGLGSFLSTGEPADALALKQSKVSMPQTIAKTEPAADLPQNSNRQNKVQNAPKSEPDTTPGANQNAPENRRSQVVKAAEEKTYYCGAATKKGTPCSRKVKGGGRCWQHKGQDALFPQEKLTITQ